MACCPPSELTEEERAQLEEYLAEAKAAMHKVMVGKTARVFVDQNGERVEYAFTNADKLRAYIMSLESQLGKLCITGPMNVWMM